MLSKYLPDDIIRYIISDYLLPKEQWGVVMRQLLLHHRLLRPNEYKRCQRCKVGDTIHEFIDKKRTKLFKTCAKCRHYVSNYKKTSKLFKAIKRDIEKNILTTKYFVEFKIKDFDNKVVRTNRVF